MTRKTLKRGGSENWLGYRYTKDETRRAWVDTIAPLSPSILTIPQKINWSGFNYEGPISFEIDVLDDPNAKFTRYSSTHKITTTGRFESQNSPMQYQVFGGGACELWGKAYPQVPIRKYVDYTGDIDIIVGLPKFSACDEATNKLLDDNDLEPELIEPKLLNDKAYTPYGEAITHWLYDEVVDKTRSIMHYFNKKNIVLPDNSEDEETAIADLITKIGNLLVTRAVVQEGNAIKIQIATKVVTGDVSVMNHLMEFIFQPKGSFTISKNFKVDDIFVQEPYKLLQGQVDGLVGRGTGIKDTLTRYPNINRVENYPSYYKFDNHCARILYLAHLQKFLEGKRHPGAKYDFAYLSVAQVADMLEKIYKRGVSKMCHAHFGEDYMDKLISVFESMKYIGEGSFTTKIQPHYKGLLNRAKSETAGGRRKHRNTRRKQIR